MNAPKYPPRRCIAVDVDGTLHIGGQPNVALIAWCRVRKQDGYSLILWSAQGEEHARSVATAFGCADLFDVIVSKPGYIVDDNGWDWIKYTRALWPVDMTLQAPDGPPGLDAWLRGVNGGG